MKYVLCQLLAFAFLSCTDQEERKTDMPVVNAAADVPSVRPLRYRLQKVHMQKDPVFLQGLAQKKEGILLQSSGLYGRSFMQYYDINQGKVVQRLPLSKNIFAEGLTLFKNKIYLLTWREGKCLVYDLHFKLLQRYPLSTEGWGIAHNDSSLLVSDGTDKIYFYDAQLGLQKTISVVLPATNEKIPYLNELEYVAGYIYANVWQSKQILKINPEGAVVGILDLTALIDEYITPLRLPEDGVLNGIAYSPERQAFFISGKWWPFIFELKL